MNATIPDLGPRLDALADYFESLTPATLTRLGDFYATDAHFVDTFNNVVGTAAIGRIFADMFEKLDAPRFEVIGRYASTDTPDEAMLLWRLHCRSRQLGGALVIEGSSRLRFDASGKVAIHRDYWDAAGELYARLPLIGAVMRWLARRLAAS